MFCGVMKVEQAVSLFIACLVMLRREQANSLFYFHSASYFPSQVNSIGIEFFFIESQNFLRRGFCLSRHLKRIFVPVFGTENLD